MSAVTAATVIAGVGAAASVAGTAASALGKSEAGATSAADAKKQAAYRAQVAQNQAMLLDHEQQVQENNAKISEYNAQVDENKALLSEQAGTRAMAVGAQRAEARSQSNAVRAGKIKAAQAASGVDVNTGSNVDVQAGSRSLGVLDTETDMANAALENYGYRIAADDFRNKKTLDLYSGEMAKDQAMVTGVKANAARQGIELANSEGAAVRDTSGLAVAGSIASSASQLPLKWLGGLGGGSVAQDNGMSTLSPEAVKVDYNSLPTSYTNPGF